MKVVITPDGCEEVRDALTAWSAAGLLQPFCWWPLDGAGPSAARGATLVRDGRQEERPLAGAVEAGLSVGQTVRFVAFCPVPPDAPGADPAFTDGVRRHMEIAAEVVPLQAMAGPQQPAMVVAPAAAHQHVPPGLFHARWAANVMVVPEDAASPVAPNHIGGVEGLPALHAAHALASIAGLWLDSSRESVLEELIRRKMQTPYVGERHVQLVRVYSRLVDFGYLPDHLAAEVFQVGDQWPNPSDKRFDRTTSPDSYLPQLVSNYWEVHKGVLGTTEFEPVTPEPPPPLRILEALRILLHRAIYLIRRKPIDWFEDRIAAPIFDSISKKLEARVGARVFRYRDKLPGEQRLVEMTEDLERFGPIGAPHGAVGPAWTDLRSLALGLIDGSDVPESITGPGLLTNEDRRIVIADPGRIVPNPEVPPPVSAGDDAASVRACDPLRFDATPAGPQDIEGASESPFERALAGWVARQQGALLWEIGKLIAADLRECDDDLAKEPASTVEPQTEQQAADLQRAGRRGTRRLILLAMVVSVLAIGALVGAITQLAMPLALAPVVVVLGLWVLGLGLLVRRRLRKESAQRQDDLERELEVLNDRLLRGIRLGDRRRIQARYDDFLDWAEIIGWFAHRPWVGASLTRMDVHRLPDRSLVPYGLRTAVAKPDPGHQSELVSATRKAMYDPGWLTGMYASVERACLGEQLVLDPDAPAEAYEDPTGDTADDHDSPRRRLCRATRAGEHRDLASSPLTQGLLHRLGRASLDALAEDIVVRPGAGEPDEEQTDALPPSAAWFSAPPELSALAARLRPAVVMLRVRTPEGSSGGTGVIINSDGTIATARHVVEGAEQVTVVLSDGHELPARVLRVASTTDLALVALEAGGLPQATNAVAVAGLRPEDEAIEQGDPIVFIGHPMLLEGQPSLDWGIVSAADRRVDISWIPGVPSVDVLQASYRSTGGGSGAPVFDLAGRVVGIHISSSEEARAVGPRAAYISNAVPVRDLHSLLATSDLDPAVAPGTEPHERLRGRHLTVSTFLGELFPAERRGLKRSYWANSRVPASADDFDTPSAIDASSPPSAGPKGVTLVVPGAALHRNQQVAASLSHGPQFLRPLRVLVHRVDASAPQPVEKLAVCAQPSGGTTAQLHTQK